MTSPDSPPNPVETLRDLFLAGVGAADPFAAVQHALSDQRAPDSAKGRLHIIAFGKAANQMMRAALMHFQPQRPATAIIVTNYENAAPIAGCTCFAAGHPVPDENGLAAAQAVMDAVQDLGAEDQVLCLISGGGSALMPAPAPGVSLADKIALNKLLLAQGFDIETTNLVRQQVSTLKGGGLARLAHPARVRALILSDVIPDNVSAIASGPTASPLGTAEQAIAVLRNKGCWAALPASIKTRLTSQAAQDDAPRSHAVNQIVGSNSQSLAAIEKAARAKGLDGAIVSGHLLGDVAEAANEIISGARDPRNAGHDLLIWGGETTVTLTGTGRGGRNQELALRVALRADEIAGNWVFLSGGTDGRDGPTDAAGGCVDPGTARKIALAGLDAPALLANNDSHAALAAADALLHTGATGTNVADVQMLLRKRD